MTSSTQNHHDHHATSAPPPTPSSTTIAATSPSTDLLSRLLHRLPPNLSTTPTLLRRRSSLTNTATTISPPLVPFTDLNSTLPATLSSISKLGYFQITNHPIPSQLAHSAESDSLFIFQLNHHKIHQHFPKNWPLGFDDDDDDDNDTLFLDSCCSTESTELSLTNLREFTREMEKIGLTVVEALLCAMGLQNPFVDDVTSVCSLMLLSEGSGEKMVGSGKLYPYVVGLHYQIRKGRWSLLSDSGPVYVEPQIDSILVTLGDIAQVWSNGKLNKVRGKPTQNMEEDNNTSNILMSLLVTLPLESTVSTLQLRSVTGKEGDKNHENRNDDDDELKEDSLFNSFSFEDYAWRVYHERVPRKDPLNRYHTLN
ncbi:uncharacterized protein [Rutidosis leptorrhynchoides]|uniref:uncharacterized protein n=1 Tax=Rutidosis leptorrhynchoides TaxID=125765 RepID=UPI003A9A07E0